MKGSQLIHSIWDKLRHPSKRGKVVMLCALTLWLGWSALVRVPIDREHYLHQPDSPRLLDTHGEPLYFFLNEEDNWAFVTPLDEISPRVIEATMAFEDQRFYRHGGVDSIAVLRAVTQNLRRRKVVSGASTLTMQLVKMQDGSQRKLTSKALQAWRAIRLERVCTKEEILEAYLNVAPYGGNVVGVEAASQRYFGKPSIELTLSEAATLAGIPQAPAWYHPVRHPKASQGQRDNVLSRMRSCDMIDEAVYQKAVKQKVQAQWHDFPQQAPHIAQAYKKEIQDQGFVQLSLDADLQAAVQDEVTAYIDTFDGEITNAAVMVVDVKSAEVVARIASSDFNDTSGGGQVDLCKSPRSPGSTLKPFVYALALEQNKLYPSELLLDDTVDYGRYRPQNFDAQTSGRISATNALRESLNIPAVTLLNRIQTRSLWSLMKELKFSTVEHGPEYYGLGMALGNCEVRLDELCAAYTMLANDGVYRPLSIRSEHVPSKEQRVMSSDTAWTIGQILRQPFPTNELPQLVSSRWKAPDVAWKTGTSSGYRDAWVVAYDADYVVGVWLGNNDGRGSHRLVGAKAAVPLVERVLKQLPQKASRRNESYIPELQAVKVCPASGLPKSTACPKTKVLYMPQSVSLRRMCQVHRLDQYTQDLSTHWPGAADAWDLAHIPLTSTSRRETVAFRIQSPTNKAEYVLTDVVNGDKIQLRSTLDQHTTVHWYQNDHYLGPTGPGKPLLISLTPGEHALSCWTAHSGVQKLTYTVFNSDSNS